MTTITFNNLPLHVPLVEDITKDMPTSFEDFVQQEQKRIQKENASKGEYSTKYNVKVEVSSKKSKHVGSSSNNSSNNKNLVDSSLAVKDATSNKRAKTSTAQNVDKHTKARNAIAEAVALTNSHAVAIKNGSQSVLPGSVNATEDEIDAAMKEQKDLPVGNTKEERKKRRLVRNRVSAQLHRERKKKYIAALETKVKEQNEQLLHLGKIIQIMNIEYQRLQNAAAKNICPSCISSGSDSSIPFTSSGSDTSSSSSPLTGPESDDLDPECDDDNAKLGAKTSTSTSGVHWVKNSTPTSTSVEFSESKLGSSRMQNAARSVGYRNKRTKKLVANTRKSSLMDENIDALTNSSDEDLQKYADTLLSPVNLCDGDEEDVAANTIDKAPFDTSFIFSDDDALDSKFDDLMHSPNNTDVAHEFDLRLSDDDDDNNEDTSLMMFRCNNDDSDRASKKRKRAPNKGTALLFGMFFMCAFFGSYIGSILPSSKILIHLPSATSVGVSSLSSSSIPLLGKGNTNVAAADNTNANSYRRRRRLLSSDEAINQSDVSAVSSLSPLTPNTVNTADKAIALWQNILHDIEASSPAKYPAVGTSDVKQLLLRIGNFSHTYKSSKVNRISSSNNIASGKRKQALRARARGETTSTASTLIPYHKSNGTVDVNTVFTQNIMNTNASFMLCPKPYGSLAHTDTKPATSSSNYGTDNRYEHVPNTFMYDDIKVNRELVLLMPSTSLGGKTGMGTNQRWDGQWVQVDAVVRSVRPAAGLSGFKAIAGSQ